VLRTSAFSQVYAAVLFYELISIPLGAALITVNPWVPILGAVGFSATATAVAFLIIINYGTYVDSDANRHK
jgi:hypothetical protein